MGGVRTACVDINNIDATYDERICLMYNDYNSKWVSGFGGAVWTMYCKSWTNYVSLDILTMEHIIPKVKIYKSNVLIYQGNDIDTWNKILEPDDVLDTGHGFIIHIIENRTKWNKQFLMNQI